MQIHRFEQGTPEWFAIRRGKLTASEATAIGNCGAGLKTYVEEMMAEYFSSGEKEQFSSRHTDRGNELEPVARGIYEFERNVTVEEVGFVEYNEFVGCSPDGLVDEDPEGEGGIEIKSIEDTKYFKHLLYGDKQIESKHLWQVQMCLKVTGRKWWDLIYYNPNFKKSMCIYRIYPDQEKFDALEKGFEMGTEMIIKIKSQVETND